MQNWDYVYEHRDSRDFDIINVIIIIINLFRIQ